MAFVETKCGGCGRYYPIADFSQCPFCYVQEFLQEEARDGECTVCGEKHETVCPECGRVYKGNDTYCIQCGHIRPNGAMKGY